VGAEPPEGDLVGQGDELEGEGQVGIDAGNLVRVCHRLASPGAPCWGPNPEVLVARLPLLAVLCATVLGVTLTACDSGGSSAAKKPHRSTTTSSSSTTTTTTTGGPSTSTETSGGGATNSTVAPIGTCGNQTTTIVAAIQGSSSGGLDQNAGRYTVQRCRIAASSPIWAAAQIVPNPGVQLDGATVVLQRIGALWNVQSVGTSQVGCNAPAQIIQDLGLIC
jgi:hypothetical protein